jgi:hypothetical protein
MTTRHRRPQPPTETTCYYILVVTAAELDAARRLIAEVLDANPDALPPTPKELLAVEAAGLTWNFETGQIEAGEGEQAKPIPASNPLPLPRGVYRDAITGKLYYWTKEMRAR